jgi:hypothetical protein
MTTRNRWHGARILVLSPTPTHPQDFGNRKRIYRVCKRFSDEGANVTFVHYPAEQEWRQTKPKSAERAMLAAWHRYYTVAPTRPFHMHSAGPDHTIDEWWDPAIGQFLSWLFSVESFDLFIVNYAWLSKALEFAPRQVFKILDTHDKMSDRREMLASLGLDAEFFHTTEEEEAVALGRADLVWAIKQEEAAQFRRMAPRPVIDLPHIDPLQRIERPGPDPEGYLRIGIVGARNNVNRANILAFLNEATPLLRDSFAPARIVIAGTVCETLQGLDNPFVELRGPVGRIEDFYRTIDCVAIPMQTSTGLKIKTGEALSFGLPVLSLAHAFEGYEAADHCHVLPDFAALARALTDLSFEPRARLDRLAEASLRAHAATAQRIDGAMTRTAALARAHDRSILVTVDTRAFVPGSVPNLALESLAEVLQPYANVIVLAVRGSIPDIARNAVGVDGFRRVGVARELTDGDSVRALDELGVEIVDVAAFLAGSRPRLVVADALHPALFENLCPDASIVTRAEIVAHGEGTAVFPIPGTGFREAFVAAPAFSHELAARIASAGAKPILESCFWRSDAIAAMRLPDHSGVKSVALLGDPDSHAVGLAAAMARSWKLRPLVVRGVGGTPSKTQEGDLACVDAGAWLASLAARRAALPSFAIDLSDGALGLPLCRELLERLHVPTVRARSLAVHRSLGSTRLPLSAATEAELWQAFRWLATGTELSHASACEPVWRDHERSRGWPWLRRHFATLHAREKAA